MMQSDKLARRDWSPTLKDGPDSLYARLVDALERDVEAGALPPGTRLPPQRTLASDLGLSVGTVTKAYLEAERRGLVVGHVGRGTFVASAIPADDGEAAPPLVDLSVNVIPHQAAARRFAESVAALKRRPESLEAMAYAPPTGTDRAREAASRWIAQVAGFDIDPSLLVITNGAQQAMALAFNLLCQKGDTVLCEEATFYGMKSLADHTGLSLHGVPMDGEGVLPQALAEIARKTRARVAYLMPTVQNPTARTMSKSRRREIVKVLRENDLWAVEDDNYAIFAPAGKASLPALASLAPERCIYLGGVSKSVAPGLRLGYMRCASEEQLETVVRAVRSTVYAPPSLGGLLFSEWVGDGTAFEIADSVRREVDARADLCREMLDRPFASAVVNAPHFWLPMDELAAERLAGRALRAGVALTPPNAPVPPGSQVSGIRVCIGAAASAAQLGVGLERLRIALATNEPAPAMDMV
jgi:DNA-binding transcriptional MocR family regulator